MIRAFLRLFILLSLLSSVCSYAAVVLQYHHVGTDTPFSTSVSEDDFRAHLDWLEKNHFRVVRLDELVKRIKNNTLDSRDKLASISFDDAGSSVCQRAWPILKRKKIPFTLFVNTDLLDKAGSCTWKELRQMVESGLLIIGNHGHTHINMVDVFLSYPEKVSREMIVADVKAAEALIIENTGFKPGLFAYPYGEYNTFIQDIIGELGYVAFGQQSGAVGNRSELLSLPRFPLSGRYADVSGLADKLLSLPFDLVSQPAKDTLVRYNSKNNPPELMLSFEEPLVSSVSCFLSTGKPIEVESVNKTTLSAKSPSRLVLGRHKYNCTSPSSYKGRFYWFSQLWIVVPE